MGGTNKNLEINNALVRRHLLRYNGSKALCDETTNQYLKTAELFLGLVGDHNLGHIQFDETAAFDEFTLELPSWGQLAELQLDCPHGMADKLFRVGGR